MLVNYLVFCIYCIDLSVVVSLGFLWERTLGKTNALELSRLRSFENDGSGSGSFCSVNKGLILIFVIFEMECRGSIDSSVGST